MEEEQAHLGTETRAVGAENANNQCCALPCLLLTADALSQGDCQLHKNPGECCFSSTPCSSSPASSESDFRLALHAAAFRGKGELVDYLLATGSEVNGRDCDGCTPLHIAVRRPPSSVPSNASEDGDLWDDRSIIKMLLSYGARVNATNGGKKTALHYAASVGKKDVVELLLDNGAESWHRDEDGANALDLARAAGHTEVIPPLCEAEVKIFQRLEQLEALCMQLQQGQSQAQEEIRRRMDALERAVRRATRSNTSDQDEENDS